MVLNSSWFKCFLIVQIEYISKLLWEN